LSPRHSKLQQPEQQECQLQRRPGASIESSQPILPASMVGPNTAGLQLSSVSTTDLSASDNAGAADDNGLYVSKSISISALEPLAAPSPSRGGIGASSSSTPAQTPTPGSKRRDLGLRVNTSNLTPTVRMSDGTIQESDLPD
jgi:hypothetical protein